MEINIGDYYYQIDNGYVFLAILIICIIGIVIYRKTRNMLILPMVTFICGLLLKQHFFTVNIGDTYYMISYFFIGLASALIFTMYIIIKRKQRNKV